MSDSFPIAVMHNVSSASRVQEFVTIAVGLGYRTVIISSPQGSAAQRGVPAAQKAAYKAKCNFMVLESLQDIKDLFVLDEFVIVAPSPYGKEDLTDEFVDSLSGKKFVVVVGGNDSGLSRKDLDLGRTVQLPVGKIGSVGLATLALARLNKVV